jgi:hypothetical protein
VDGYLGGVVHTSETPISDVHRLLCRRCHHIKPDGGINRRSCTGGILACDGWLVVSHLPSRPIVTHLPAHTVRVDKIV